MSIVIVGVRCRVLGASSPAPFSGHVSTGLSDIATVLSPLHGYQQSFPDVPRYVCFYWRTSNHPSELYLCVPTFVSRAAIYSERCQRAVLAVMEAIAAVKSKMAIEQRGRSFLHSLFLPVFLVKLRLCNSALSA